jgi:hypothetical protein
MKSPSAQIKTQNQQKDNNSDESDKEAKFPL